jgi:hypothetical protein
MSLFQGGVVGPTLNPQLSWRANVFCQGCLPYLASPSFKASGSRFLPLYDLAVETLPRSHDMDMHATDLVGINGIARVLLVYTCQQGVYPRGHVQLLRSSSDDYEV